MTEANGCPECLRETVASDPLRAWSTSVRARSANVGSGTAGTSGAPGGPAWRFMARSQAHDAVTPVHGAVTPVMSGWGRASLARRGRAAASRLTVWTSLGMYRV